MDNTRPESLVTNSAMIGKYRPIAALGSGGMANIYLAVMQGRGGFNKLVVLKIPRPEVITNPTALSMFLDEARLGARLSHPNIVQTFEVINENGVEIMVMEYLDGYTVNALVSRSRKVDDRLSLGMHLKILSEALTGLHYAHEATDLDGSPLSFVHRDFSPHNIFVTFDGQIKVLDFGVAKATTQSNKTEYGTFKGKVRYMPAEQLSAHDIDRRADVFAAGAMIWEAAVGHRLWRERSDIEVMSAVLSGDIPAPKDMNPEVPDAIDAICRKAMAHKKVDRYADCLELQADIEKYLAELPTRPTVRDIVRHMDTVFKEPRAIRKKFIEEQLKTVDFSNPVTALAGLPTAAPPSLPSLSSSATGFTPLRLSQSGSSSGFGRSPVPTTASVASFETSLEEKPSRSRLIPALLLLLVFAVGAIAVLLYRETNASRAVSETTSPASSTGGDVAAKSSFPASGGTASATSNVGLSTDPRPSEPTGTASDPPRADAATPLASAASVGHGAANASGSSHKFRPVPGATHSASVTAQPATSASNNPPKTARDCSNPFYINERGVRSVFPECL